MAIFCPSWLPLYHSVTTWLQFHQLTPIVGHLVFMQYQISHSTRNDYAYCLKLDCAPNSNPQFPVPLCPDLARLLNYDLCAKTKN